VFPSLVFGSTEIVRPKGPSRALFDLDDSGPFAGVWAVSQAEASAMLGSSASNSPAGVEAAKSGANPALSRNCDAPPAGMSQVDRSAPTER
jgi:hypothetical protein